MDYKIVHVMDHYVVFIEGKFVCSGDTYNEASREADAYLAERRL